MVAMFVTLDVFQFSGWLKAFATCRGLQKQGTRCGASCGPGGERRRPTAGQAACRGARDCRDWGGQGVGGCAL